MSDLYEDSGSASIYVTDYLNEYANLNQLIREAQNARGIQGSYRTNFSDTDLHKALSQYHVKTVKERYRSRKWRKSKAWNEFTKFPEKIERLSKLAQVVNSVPDVRTYKRIYNEMLRVIYGRETEFSNFPEPEFHPDLLEI